MAGPLRVGDEIAGYHVIAIWQWTQLGRHRMLRVVAKRVEGLPVLVTWTGEMLGETPEHAERNAHACAVAHFRRLDDLVAR